MVKDLSRPKVLIADDSSEVAIRISEMVRETCDVEIAGPVGNGIAALELLDGMELAAAVLDLTMPGIDGLELTRTARRKHRSCLLIVLTQHTEPSLRDACLEAGADHFLHKSSDFERIPELIQAHLTERRD